MTEEERRALALTLAVRSYGGSSTVQRDYIMNRAAAFVEYIKTGKKT